MGIPVMVIGKSGAGKSASLRNFAEGGLYLINVLGKPLPFKKQFESTLRTDDYTTVRRALEKSRKDAIAIDDAGYLITNHFMKNHASTGGGNAVYSLYNEIGDKYWELVGHVTDVLPPEKIVYFMMHEDKDETGDIKPKTIGKLLNEKVCLEGMFTIVLRCMGENGRHYFRTKTTGADVTKAPMGMFGEEEIDNDLMAVDADIREYYGLKK